DFPGPQNWARLVSSADGTTLFALPSFPQNLYLSTDGGVTWTLRSSRADSSFAASADGKKLVAVSKGNLYTSTDAGATWTEHVLQAAPSPTAVASSADGT